VIKRRPHAKTQSRKGRPKRTENERARIVVDVAFKIHSRLGRGLLEPVYEAILL
jgi:hypothetical protein